MEFWINKKSKKNTNTFLIKINLSKDKYNKIDQFSILNYFNIHNQEYLLTCDEHFSKYVWTIPIKNKEAIIVRNAIAQVFNQGFPEILQSDNEREFANRILEIYLICINVKHILA